MSNTITQATKNANDNRRRRLLSTTALVAAGMMMTSPAKAQAIDPHADWDDLNIVAGDADVLDTGLGSTQIDQHTMRAVGEAQEIHIGELGAVNINQIDSNALFVARAIGDHDDPTQILGSLSADGRVMILDRNGVIFGANSIVDVAGIAASTGDVSNADIMDGDESFHFNNFGDGRIELRGTISVADSGLAAFVSPTVINSGIINAKMGTVVMAAGETVTLDLYGDGLVEVTVEGELGDALLETTGEINAEGGTVTMTASAAKDVVDNIINVEGVITVASATQEGGKIVLSGGDNGTTMVAGTLDASGTEGGEIDIDGGEVVLADTSSIKADANDASGEAGSIVAWGDELYSYGALSVLGQNGFVETSNREGGEIAGTVVLGENSEWVIDPTDSCIADAAASCGLGDTFVFTDTLEDSLNTALGGSTILVQTSPVANGGDFGHIRVLDALDTATTAAGVGLRLEAHQDVRVSDTITDTGLGLNVELIADFDGSGGDADVEIGTGGAITTNGGHFIAEAADDIEIDAAIDTDGGDVTLHAKGMDTDESFVSISSTGSIDTDDSDPDGDVTIITEDLFIHTASGDKIRAGFDGVNDGTITIKRSTAGTVGLGSGSGDMEISQAELEVIDGGALVIGDATAVDNNVTEVNVEDVDTTVGTIGGLVQLNALNITGAANNPDVNFDGSNTFNALEVNVGDDVNFFAGADVETLIGGMVFNADADADAGTGDSNRVHIWTDGTVIDSATDITFSGLDYTDDGADTDVTAMGGDGTITFTRSDDGDMSVGDDNGGYHISQIELDHLSAGELVFGVQGGGTDNNIFIDNADTTHVDKTTVNTEIPSGPFDVTFMGTNEFNELEVNAEDDIIFAAGASVETHGDALFNADSDMGDFGDFIMNAGSMIDSNGFNITVETGNSGGGNASHGVFLDTGVMVNAEGGDIDFNNDSSFFSADADSVKTMGTGTIEINQFDEGSIQNAVDAVENTGTGTNTIFAAAGLYSESVTIAEDNFIISGANAGIAGDGVRGAESTVDPNSPGFLITGNNAVIDGMEIINGTAGVIVDGGDNATIKNNDIHGQFHASGAGASFGAPGLGDGVYITNSDGSKVLNNKISEYNDDGVQVSGASNIEVSGNVVMDNGTGDLGIGIFDATGTVDVIGNTVTNALRQGIQILASNITGDVSGNTVTGSVSAGISVRDSEGDISVDDNTISGGLVGVSVANSEDVIVGDDDGDNDSGNTISSVGTGVQVDGGDDIEVIDNTISDVDNGVVATGVAVDGLDIAENDITGSSSIGIDVDSSAFANIDNNIVTHFTTGIQVTDSDHTGIEGNTVTDITANGIEVDGSESTDIIDNIVGNAAVAGDIGGDGIHVSNSPIAKIQGNTVTNANGDGIELISSDISAIGGLGIGEGNTVMNILGHGIASFFSSSPDIIGNMVTRIGLNGIHLQNGSDAQVRSNTVRNTVGDGIESNSNFDIQITDNMIGTGSFADNIRMHGIDVNNSDNADILGNTITETVGIGISVNPSDDVVIDDNTISNTGQHGIHVLGGNDIQITNNNLSNTGAFGWSGIVTNGSSLVRILSNIINTAGWDGIQVANGSDVEVNNNDLDNITISGIAILGSDDVLVDNNTVDVSQRGIYTGNATNTTLNNNNIDTTSNDGIEANSSANIQITNNMIGTDGGVDNIGAEGIDVNNSPSADILGNTVTETGHNGISVNPSPGSIIDGNTITNVGWDGIASLGSDDVQITNNTINGTVASGVAVIGGSNNLVDTNDIDNTGRLGVYVGRGDGVVVNNNTIDNAGTLGIWSGVHIEDTDGGTVTDNTINIASHDGINLGDPINFGVTGNTGLFTVDNNTIDNTGRDGVHAHSTDGVQVTNNDIGTNGGPGNIGDDGVHINGSNGALVQDNTINNTVDNGVEVNPSDDVVIADNIIDEIGGDGVQITDGKRNKVLRNTITDVTGNGIRVNGHEDLIVRKNTIKDVGSDGISLVDIIGGLIKLNKIEKDDSANSTGDEGIEVDDSSDIVITENTVKDTANDGIEATDVDGLDITLNKVRRAGTQGIEVDGGSTDVKIDDNIVTASDDEGIDVNDVHGLRIRRNTVTDSGKEGIEVTNSTDAKIRKNIVTNSGTDGAFDGIFVDNTPGVEVFQNIVTTATDDGIHVSGSNGATINENTVSDVDGNGIHVNPSSNVVIADNDIFHATENGVKVEGGSNNTIRDNLILFSGDDGIDVEDNHHLNIRDNIVGFSGDDGIDVEDSYYVRIHHNLVGVTGLNEDDGDGIEVHGGAYYDIHGNKVLLTARDGIHVGNVNYNGDYVDPYYGGQYYGGYMVNIHDNEVALIGRDGIHVHDSGKTRIAYNDVFATGLAFIDLFNGDNDFVINPDGIGFEWGDGDGIHAENIHGYYGGYYGGGDHYDLKIYGNDVSWTGGDGIQAKNFGYGYIGGDSEEYGNNIRYAGIDGTFWNWGTVTDQLQLLHDNKERVIHGGLNALFGDGNIVSFLKRVIPSPDMVYGDNHDGINIRGFGGAYIGWNDIEFTGDDGIAAAHGDYVRIYENWVGKNGIMPTLNGGSPFGADSIHVRDVGSSDYDYSEYYGNQYGYGIEVYDNFLSFADDDGIDIRGGHSAYVAHNIIGHMGTAGIGLQNVDYSVIKRNAVSMVGDDGIFVTNGYATKILGNKVLMAGDDGIEVTDVGYKDGDVWDDKDYSYYYDYFGGWAVNVARNEVAFTGDNGIRVADTGPARIVRNDVMFAGLGEENFAGMINWVNETAISTYVGGRPNPPGPYFFSKKWYWGDGDGINVENVHGYGPHGLSLNIGHNKVTATGGDGIDVNYAGRTVIHNNHVRYAGIDKTSWDYEYRGTYGLTAILDSGLFNEPERETLWEGQRMNPLIRQHLPKPKKVKFDRYENHDGIRAENIYAHDYDYDHDHYYGGGNDYYGGYYGHGNNNYHGQYGPLSDYSLVVYNNDVAYTADDGIEVIGSNGQPQEWDHDWPAGTGRTLIADNDVMDTGIKSIQYGHDRDYYGGGDYQGDYYGGGYGDYGYYDGKRVRYGNGDYYGADGIHVRNVHNDDNVVFLGGYYGGYYGGYTVNILNNYINTTSDDGIEVVDSGSTLIDYNHISNVGVTSPHRRKGKDDNKGYYGSYERDQYGADGIHVRNVHIDGNQFPGYYGGGDHFQPYAVVIRRNHIKNTSDDGIEVLDSGRTLIDYNTVYNTGLYGYHDVHYGDDYYGGGEGSKDGYYGYRSYHFSGSDYYGGDGIHVRNVHNNFIFRPPAIDGPQGVYPGGYYGGYAVEITNNHIDMTGDDGIEVVYSGNTLIDNNDIYNVGVNMLPHHDEYYGGDKNKGDYDQEWDEWGADGIHVRDVLGNVRIVRGGDIGVALPGYAVEVTNNHIDNTADDGIQVLWSGNTLVSDNEVLNAGAVVEDYFNEYGDYYGYDDVYKFGIKSHLQDDHGADGIHVHSGFFKHGLPGLETGPQDDIGYNPYFLSTYVEITNNTVGSIDEESGETSQGAADDGIETEGITDLLISDNDVYDSGDDGIKVIGYAGFFANEQDCVDCNEPVTILTGGGPSESPEFNVVISGNVVVDSGTPEDEDFEEEDQNPESISFKGKKGKHRGIGVNYHGEAHGDGIEVTNYDRIDIIDNDVTNSEKNGLYISGPFNARFESNLLEDQNPDSRRVFVSGNTFTNNDVGAHFESGLIDLVTGDTNNFIGGRVGLLFKPFDFSTIESKHHGDDHYYDYGYTKVTPRTFGAWQGKPLHTLVPTEGYADLALIDDDGPGSTPYPEFPENFGGSIGAQFFNGQSQFFVELDNEAFFDNDAGLPIWQNALNSTYVTPFGTITPADTDGVLTFDQFSFLEDKFFHFPDRGNIGIFFFGFVPVGIDQERVFNQFGPFGPGLSGLNVTVTGLPPVNLGPEALAGLTPAAGGEETAEDLANIEPAAGGEDVGCWSQGLNVGGTFNYIFEGGAEESITDAANGECL